MILSNSDECARTSSDIVALIVEDDTFIRAMHVRVAKSLGIQQVLSAADANEAVELSNTMGHVDLIISDLAMPEADGLDLIRIFPKDEKKTVVMFVTQLPTGILAAAETLALDQGFLIAPSVQKPLKPDAVKEALDMLIARIH